MGTLKKKKGARQKISDKKLISVLKMLLGKGIKVAIISKGDIIPCHIARDEITGNIKDIRLNKIIRKGKMDFYWNLSKDKLMTCNQCEYRYVCFNCPIIEHRKVNQEFKENRFCKYNPINGKKEI